MAQPYRIQTRNSLTEGSWVDWFNFTYLRRPHWAQRRRGAGNHQQILSGNYTLSKGTSMRPGLQFNLTNTRYPLLQLLVGSIMMLALGSMGSDCRADGGPLITSQEAKLTPADAAQGDRFGNSLVLSGDTALVGANWDDTPAGTDVGSAYVFRITFPPAALPYFANCQLSAGHFASDLCGESGSTVVVEASSNLTDWIPVSTNVLGSEPLPWSDTGSTQLPKRFYRLLQR